MLRDHDTRAGGQADKKADHQIDDRQIRAADGGQRRLADQPPEDDGVDHGIQLLQKRAQHDRQEEAGHIRKNRAVQQVGRPGGCVFHTGDTSFTGRNVSPTILAVFTEFARGIALIFFLTHRRSDGIMWADHRQSNTGALGDRLRLRFRMSLKPDPGNAGVGSCFVYGLVSIRCVLHDNRSGCVRYFFISGGIFYEKIQADASLPVRSGHHDRACADPRVSQAL